MQALAILGASGHGKVVADAALSSGWEHLLFFDDVWPKVTNIHDWQVVGTLADVVHYQHQISAAIVAIGDNLTRVNQSNWLRERGISCATIIHSRAIVSRYASIGDGTVVLAGAVLNIDCQVASDCIVNTNAVVEHDCRLSDGVHVSPGAHLGGGVTIGARTWVGIGANVKNSIHIGSNVIVGAGACVIENVPNHYVVAGVPAKFISEREGCRA